MFKRYSIVNELTGITLSFSSVYQLGDSQNIFSTSKAYAVQREKEFFLTSEGSFDSRVFQAPIELPPVNPGVHVNRMNLAPIKVNCMEVRATSFSSIIHIGNTCNVYMDARVKNIRQLESDAEYSEEQLEKLEEAELTEPQELNDEELIEFVEYRKPPDNDSKNKSI